MWKLLPIAVLGSFWLPAAVEASENEASVVFATVKVTVYPGDTITGEIVNLVHGTSFPAAGGAITDRESLIGKVARRTLVAGQPIPRTAIREPFIIQQGKTIPLVFQSGNITIDGVALALESGSAGDVINARNPDSGTVIRGVVQPDGSLRAQ